jgi:predicted MFS family arabinose efflux permease
MGGAGGSAIGGATYSLTADWRSAFLVAPLLGIAVVAGLFVAQGAFYRADAKVGMLSVGRDALGLLRRKSLLVVLVFALLATYPIATWQFYLAKYWNSVSGVSVPLAAYGYSAVLISGGAGKVALGRLSDRWPRQNLLAVASAAATALFILFFLEANVVLGFVLALSASFISSALFPVMQALASDWCDGRTGTALGLTTSFQSVATVMSPTLTALLFPQGVAKAIAINVALPMVAVTVVALILAVIGKNRENGIRGP